MTQEFLISVTPVGQDKYIVRTEQVAPGVPLAEEILILPVNHWLSQAAQLSSQNKHTDPFLPKNQENLGQQLYNGIFHGTIRSSWLIAQEIARTSQDILRLRLAIKEAHLASLPWESLHLGDRFLATDSAIAFSYYRCDPELNLLDEEWEQDSSEVEYDASTYEEDSALVSELFRQINNPSAKVGILEQDEQKRENGGCAPTPLVHSPPSQPPSQARELPRLNLTQNNCQIWMIFGFVGASALLLLGFWWIQKQNSQPAPASPSVRQSSLRNGWQRQAQKVLRTSRDTYTLPIQNGDLLSQEFTASSLLPFSKSSAQIANVDLKIVNTETLRAIAIDEFNRGDLKAGYLAVEELLERKALESAGLALKTVSKLQNPDISFLRGRLKWQAIQVGKNEKLDEVLREWKVAVQGQPNSVLYHNALGFAYYAQGDLNRANQTWFQALYLVEEQIGNPSFRQQDALNTYAGLALVLSRAAHYHPTDKREQLLSEAIKLRQRVLTEDPVNFQPQVLSKNWLWTQKANQDWRLLLQLAVNRYKN